MGELSYFYDNIDKLISDELLTDKEEFVKVEELFNINIVDFKIDPSKLENNDNILILYILCIHKMSAFKQDTIVRHKLTQFFNYHKGNKEQTGGSHIILLNTIKKYIMDQVSQIQPKPKHLE
jgi:hypothetical protein